MTILICHEGGHFIQALRHRVPASLPYFLPFPLGPIGTFGAVIAMSSRVGNRRALFDIGVTGPLAGLVPTLLFCYVGLQYSYVAPIVPGAQRFGEPLILKWLFAAEFGPIPEGHDVFLHPMAWAGWVGLFITALNLIPIGQLDGGHILYALTPRHANRVAMFLLLFGAAAAIVFWWWLPMILLLLLLGHKHPPTAADHIPLGTGRVLLGLLTLSYIFIGFTPKPVIMDDELLRETPPVFERSPKRQVPRPQQPRQPIEPEPIEQVEPIWVFHPDELTPRFWASSAILKTSKFEKKVTVTKRSDVSEYNQSPFNSSSSSNSSVDSPANPAVFLSHPYVAGKGIRFPQVSFRADSLWERSDLL